ncbi:MAG TPA: MiaB/RimO family radical SAM methylthiotransferase [Candidatus Limnocylindrales bacterium]|nr:MiaB/RimO family radical SAM methylthiotransferase [Candidatus Limnocylindrales bacterium]
MARPLPVLDTALLPAPARPGRRPAALPDGLAEFAIDDVVLPTFHVWTLGCQMNRSDSEEMAGALLAAGCAEAPALEAAELIVINSCAIREAAEQKVIGRMGALARLKAARPGLRVVLTGCGVREENAVRLAHRYPAVDLFLRPDEEPELVARLGLAGATPAGNVAGTPLPGGPGAGLASHRAAAVGEGHLARQSAVQAWLPIIYGCDKTCTYCIVPFSRGPERSRPFDDVVAEARALGSAGYREVTLLGQNVNSYGHDLAPEPRFAGVHAARQLGRRIPLDGRPDIAALLRAIDGLRTADGRPAIPRLRFVTSHPWDLGPRLIAAMAECRSVCEHLHLPVQAGDDQVLRRMGRQYTVAAYLGLVAALRAAVPEISLTTDVIVGFPGETEAQFESTLELLRTVGFDQVFAAAFSARPGTPAARLADDVPPGEKRRRLNALLALQEGIGQEQLRRFEGHATEVLVESVRPERGAHDHDAPLDERPGQGPMVGAVVGTDAGVPLAGRNRQNRLVHLRGPQELVGRLVEVAVEHAGPYALVGRLVDEGCLVGA